MTGKPSAQTNTPDKSNNEVTLEKALELAKGHHQAGNYMIADRTYRDILRAVPDHFPTIHLLGILLFQTGNFEDALPFLEKSTQIEPDDKNCWNNYGGVLTQLEYYEEALLAYDKALAIDPDYTDALNNKSYTLWSLERYEDAEKLTKQALKKSPDNLTALINLGITLARLNRYEESLEIWNKAAKLNQASVQVWSNWGNA